MASKGLWRSTKMYPDEASVLSVSTPKTRPTDPARGGVSRSGISTVPATDQNRPEESRKKPSCSPSGETEQDWSANTDAGSLKKRKIDEGTSEHGHINQPQPSGSAEVTNVGPTWSHRSVSVWSQYRKDVQVEFGSASFYFASSRTGDQGLAMLQKHTSHKLSERIALLSKSRSRHFVECVGSFESRSEVYFVFEHMHMSLYHVSYAVRVPWEHEIVVIAAQLVGGLEALERHRIVHERLRLCNIHLDLTGRVKIFLDESCHVDPDDTTCHQSNVQALGDLLCELVTCPNDAGMLSLSTLPSGYSKDFLDFVDETSRGELSALKQHRLLARPWKIGNLHALLSITMMSCRFSYHDVVSPSLSRHGE